MMMMMMMISAWWVRQLLHSEGLKTGPTIPCSSSHQLVLSEPNHLLHNHFILQNNGISHATITHTHTHTSDSSVLTGILFFSHCDHDPRKEYFCLSFYPSKLMAASSLEPQPRPALVCRAVHSCLGLGGSAQLSHESQQICQ